MPFPHVKLRIVQSRGRNVQRIGENLRKVSGFQSPEDMCDKTEFSAVFNESDSDPVYPSAISSPA